MEDTNKGFDKPLEIYGLKSLQFRLSVSLFLIVIFAVLSFFVAFYSFEAYFRKVNETISTHYKLIEVRNDFTEMNSYAEAYFKTGDTEKLEMYRDIQSELDTYIANIRNFDMDFLSDEHRTISDAVYTGYFNYTTDMLELMNKNDDTETLYQQYQEYETDREYITVCINRLNETTTVDARPLYDGIIHKTVLQKISFVIVFSMFIICCIYTAVIVIKHILKPLFTISQVSREISVGNFDFPEIQPINNDSNEMNTIISCFNSIKSDMQEMYHTNIKNSNIAEKLIAEQKKNKNIENALLTQKYKNEILYRKANYDNLTQILNRNAFESKVKKSLDEFDGNSLGALFVIDVDNFKSVNDTLGHQGGDEVLKSVAHCLTNVLSECGFAGRWGGDEFVGFIKQSPNIDFIHQKASDLCCIMNKKFMFKGTIHNVSISVGVCPMRKNDDLEQAYQYADEMLYDVKEMGRNNFKIYIEDAKTSVLKSKKISL